MFSINLDTFLVNLDTFLVNVDTLLVNFDAFFVNLDKNKQFKSLKGHVFASNVCNRNRSFKIISPYF